MNRDAQIEQLARHLGTDALRNEPLAPRTSIRVGGAAELWVRPSTEEALTWVLFQARALQLPVTVLGGGANTLVGDRGVEGVTLKLPSDLFAEKIEDQDPQLLVTLGAGASIARLVQLMRAQHRVGAEFLAGIPGTIGGAVSMNAGTKHGECMSTVDAVEVATGDGVGWIPRSDLHWVYRHTELPPASVVTRVRFRLSVGDTEQSKAAMDSDLAYRKRTQPLTLPNFGSVFQNPPGDFAGRLIELVALKGHRVGQAQISEVHANWIVNLGGATARDVVELISLAQARVFEQTGTSLQPEVKRIGSFEP